ASITPSTPALCFGSTVLTLTEGSSPTAPATGTNVYTWSGPAGVISTVSSLSAGSTATVTPGSTAYSGVYSLSATYSETGCNSNLVTTSVTVVAQPNITALTSNIGSNPFCSGGVMTLTTTASGGTGTPTYTWSGPGISVTTGSSGI